MEFERLLMVHVLVNYWKLLFLLLIIATSYCKAVIPRISIHCVCQGQDVCFNYNSPLAHQILYAQFGEQKEGEMGPDPFLMRVDKKNKVHEVSNTSYSDRLFYNGRVQDGFLLFGLQNTQVNDSRTFRIYLKEVKKETAMYAVDFKLLVKDNCTSTVTVTSTAVLNVTPTAISKRPGISTNGTTLGPGNNTKGNTTSKNHDTTTIVKIVGSVLGFIFLSILTSCFIKCCIKRRNVNAAGIRSDMEMADSSCNTTGENTIDESICKSDCFIEHDEPAPDLADGDIENYTNERPGIRSELE